MKKTVTIPLCLTVLGTTLLSGCADRPLEVACGLVEKHINEKLPSPPPTPTDPEAGKALYGAKNWYHSEEFTFQWKESSKSYVAEVKVPPSSKLINVLYVGQADHRLATTIKLESAGTFYNIGSEAVQEKASEVAQVKAYTITPPNDGFHKLHLEMPGPREALEAKELIAKLVFNYTDELGTYHYQANDQKLVGTPVKYTTYLYDRAQSDAVPSPVGQELGISMTATGPGPKTVNAVATLDPLTKKAKAEFTPDVEGLWKIKLQWRGTYQGKAFQRSVEEMVLVKKAELVLTGAPVATVLPEAREIGLTLPLRTSANFFDLDRDPSTPPQNRQFLVSADAYAVEADGRQVPLARIKNMYKLTPTSPAELKTFLNVGWAAMAKVDLTRPVNFLFKNVEVSPTDDLTNIMLRVPEFRQTLQVVGTEEGQMPEAPGEVTAPTPEMLAGSNRPSCLDPSPDGSDVGNHGIVFVHGFCENPHTWFSVKKLADSKPEAKEELDKYVFIYDLREVAKNKPYEVGKVYDHKSMSNDDFAHNIHAYAEKKKLKSYSIVGHSQGGLAAAHLRFFYHSNLDFKMPELNPGVRIQTLGTPWGGTPLVAAGTSIAIGTSGLAFILNGCIFAPNFDMSLGQATVLRDKFYRNVGPEIEVHATAGTTDGSKFKRCHWLTDIFLADPSDGVVEDFRSTLDTASSYDFKFGQCHVTKENFKPFDFNYTPQTEDMARNLRFACRAAFPEGFEGFTHLCKDF